MTATADFSGNSVAIQRVREQIARQSYLPFPLVIEGEQGSGRKNAAHHLHQSGSCKERAIYTIDATDPEAIFPSRAELFHSGGFIVIEEVGVASSFFQDRCWKWLRLLPELHPNFRIVSTCQGCLGNRVAARKFRSDLYLRLRVASLEIPPLRSRLDDIPYLIRDFLQEAAQNSGEEVKMLTAEAMDWVLKFSWPGNVSQLRDEIFRAAAATPGKAIPREAIQPDLVLDPDEIAPLCVRENKSLAEKLKDYERSEILNALQEVGGYRDRAAELLGIDRRTLQRKIRHYKYCGRWEERPLRAQKTS